MDRAIGLAAGRLDPAQITIAGVFRAEGVPTADFTRHIHVAELRRTGHGPSYDDISFAIDCYRMPVVIALASRGVNPKQLAIGIILRHEQIIIARVGELHAV